MSHDHALFLCTNAYRPYSLIRGRRTFNDEPGAQEQARQAKALAEFWHPSNRYNGD